MPTKKDKPQDDPPDGNDEAIVGAKKENADDDDDDNIDSREVLLPMSPLKYSRIMGSLPRDDGSTSLSVKITSSTIGRVVVRPSALSSSPSNNDSRKRQQSSDIIEEYDDDHDDDEIDQSLTRVYHVLALGFQDGNIRLVDAQTGLSVLFGSTFTEPGAWFVNQTPRRGYDVTQKIIALSFDSSSSYLSAINANGECAAFGPLIWGKQSQRSSSSSSSSSSPSSSGGDGQQVMKLSGFMGTLGNNKELDQKTETQRNVVSHHVLQRPPFTLVKPLTYTARFIIKKLMEKSSVLKIKQGWMISKVLGRERLNMNDRDVKRNVKKDKRKLLIKNTR